MTAGLKNSIKVTTATLLTVVLTIGLWRSLYAYGTISTVSLIPLTILIVIGSYHTLLGQRQANLDSILTESTRLRKILKGRVFSLFQSLIIAAGGIFLVAYKGLAAENWEVMVGTLTVISTGVSFAILFGRLETHVNKKYLLTAVSNFNIGIIGSVFFLIYIYLLWNIQEHPSYLVNESLIDALNIAINDLPQGTGITAVFVEYAFALDTLKRWAVVNSASSVPITAIVYALYGAIFGYLQVKVVTSVVCAVWLIINSDRFRRVMCMVGNTKVDNGKKVSSGKIFSRVFWLFIFIMFATNVTFYLISVTKEGDSAVNQSKSEQSTGSAIPEKYVIQSSLLRTLLVGSLPQTVSYLTNGDFIVAGVDALYAPVYDSVNKYADIHYTVRGGYSEIWASTFGDPAAKIEEILFVGFDIRLNTLARDTDKEFNAELERNFNSRLDQELPDGIERSNVSSITETIIQDTLNRIKVSAPVSTIASAAGAFGTKVVIQKLSSQFVAALVVKTGAKIATKSAITVAGGIATGAATGAVFGPVGAAIGGAAAAIGIWLAVDKLFVEGAEFFNRESFEAELISMIDESKKEMKLQLLAAVDDKAKRIENFTLRDLGAQ